MYRINRILYIFLLLLCIYSISIHSLEVPKMRDNIEQRAEELAVYIIENHATVRAAAKQFGVSKSTVHTVVTK